MKKPVLVMFGGVSAEHEVSIITGLQVVERIDQSTYEPHPVFVTKQGELLYLPSLHSRKDFFTANRKSLTFGRGASGGYIQTAGMFGKKLYPYAAYLAFHGGTGESGPVQGLLESVGISFTSPGQEGSVIAMNKELTKTVAAAAGVQVVPGISLFSHDIKQSSQAAVAKIKEQIGLPAIIKPAHLGSSIAINVAKTDIELEKFLLEATFVDIEIVVEKYLTGFTEYNCAVRRIHGEIEASAIEHPLSKDEILSFADKYQRGGKKTGAGMASLQRELPAKIDQALKIKIEETAKAIFAACRLKGMVRIDFMLASDGTLYLTEVNPIPGSMAFYLWEANGIPFKQQITDLIEQAVEDAATTSALRLDYETDIVEKFTKSS